MVKLDQVTQEERMERGKAMALTPYSLLEAKHSTNSTRGQTNKTIQKWLPGPPVPAALMWLIWVPEINFRDLSPAGLGPLVEIPPESSSQQGLKRGHSPGSLPWVWCGW